MVVPDGVSRDYNKNLEKVTSDPFDTSYFQQHLENDKESADKTDEYKLK